MISIFLYPVWPYQKGLSEGKLCLLIFSKGSFWHILDLLCPPDSTQLAALFGFFEVAKKGNDLGLQIPSETEPSKNTSCSFLEGIWSPRVTPGPTCGRLKTHLRSCFSKELWDLSVTVFLVLPFWRFLRRLGLTKVFFSRVLYGTLWQTLVFQCFF